MARLKPRNTFVFGLTLVAFLALAVVILLVTRLPDRPLALMRILAFMAYTMAYTSILGVLFNRAD